MRVHHTATSGVPAAPRAAERWARRAGARTKAVWVRIWNGVGEVVRWLSVRAAALRRAYSSTLSPWAPSFHHQVFGYDAATAALLSATGAHASRRELAERAFALLADLGETPGSVAAYLEAAGVRADPSDPLGSPIARFVSSVVGVEHAVQAVACDATTAQIVPARGRMIVVPLPPAVVMFQLAFSAGLYPELEYRGEHRRNDR